MSFTFSLVQNAKVNINGSLYAGNVYIGDGESKVFEGKNNNLYIRNTTPVNTIVPPGFNPK